ncbi:MAG: D-2-hydroxyacid dehydrogenase [Bacteroidales bacterium]
MNIVILDGYGLNPGDLSWEGIESLGQVTLYDRTSSKDTVNRSRNAEALLTNKTVITREMMEQLPNLRYIGVLATGYNVIDIEAAKEKGIIVTNIPAYSTNSVAQMVFAHLLNITNQVGLHAQEVTKGRWSANKDFTFWDTPQIELAGKTIGLIGLGHTGMATAKLALAFGMKVIALTSKDSSMLPEGIVPVSKEKLFSTSDVVSLHCPLTSDTTEIINADTLALMKPSAIVINTGRGGLVNETDLSNALNNNQLYAAGIDVLSTEPPATDNPLLTAKHCYITPHIAWATLEARARLMDIATDNLHSFQQGRIKNNVAV